MNAVFLVHEKKKLVSHTYSTIELVIMIIQPKATDETKDVDFEMKKQQNGQNISTINHEHVKKNIN